MQKRPRRGFTLVEIMAVMAIMAVITALMVIAAGGARRKASVDSAKADIQLISSKIDAFYNKRGKMPLEEVTPTTEHHVYERLEEWGFGVPAEKRIDPWGNPYIIVFHEDYGRTFNIVSGAAPNGGIYETPPFDRVRHMYAATADQPKDVCAGDPAVTDPFNNQTNGYQIMSAGPDGRISRDNREETGTTGDALLDQLSVNADNLTNWQ